MIGVVIALIANAVIPLALNIQKYAHVSNTDAEGKPRRPYIQMPLWWLGISLMISGELFNLLAYGYAPTSLVAPVRFRTRNTRRNAEFGRRGSRAHRARCSDGGEKVKVTGDLCAEAFVLASMIECS
eukprot:967642-Pleurochrysis_carterae.AAC.1